MNRNTYRGFSYIKIQRFPERYKKTAFVYGDFHRYYDGSLYNFITKLPDFNDEFDTSYYNVEQDTVTQCTGLMDRHNTPIFEGDFIKYTQHKGYMLPSFIAEVVWINESACFGYKKYDNNKLFAPIPFAKHDELKTDFLDYVEVVGNIWDNKIDELFKKYYFDFEKTF